MGRLFRVVGDRYPVEMEFGGVAAQLQRSHVQMPPATVKHSKDFVGPRARTSILCLVNMPLSSWRNSAAKLACSKSLGNKHKFKS